MAKIEEGNIKLASSICRTGSHPLDDSSVVNTVADLYEFSEALYEGMMVVVNADHSIYVLTDITKVGEAAGWKKIGDASSDVAQLQQQIDKLNGAETADGSVKKIAKGYADTALTSAKTYTDGKVNVDGVASGDNILSLGSDKKLSAEVSLGYNASTKKIILLGKGNAELSTLDASAFIKDGMLEGSALYKATAATGKVTINSKEYSLSSLTANHTYIVLVWNTDAAKDAMAIDVTTLIDTYTAGNGLTLSNNQFSVDTTKIATKQSVDDANGSITALEDSVANLEGATIQGQTLKEIGEGSGLTLNGSNVKITETATSLPTQYAAPKADESLDTVVGKLTKGIEEAKTAASSAANAGVTSLAGKTGKFTLEGFSGVTDPDNGVVLSVSDNTDGSHTLKARVDNVDGSKIKDDTVEKAKLASGVRASLGKADTALQDGQGDDFINVSVDGSGTPTLSISANTANLDGESDGLVKATDARTYISFIAGSAQQAAEEHADSLMTWAVWTA